MKPTNIHTHNIHTKACQWCGERLSRVVWLSVFCSEGCSQACAKHKASTAPDTSFPIYLDRVA